MPAGKESNEADKIAERISEFKFYHELPLVTTGCDSYGAVYPEFKNLSAVYDTDSIAKSMVELLPNKAWRDEHLVITGGEPLLGWQRAYPDLLNHHVMDGLKEITFETNGTQALTPEFKTFLGHWQNGASHMGTDREVTFSVSPKLSCSGELASNAIKPEIVCEYEDVGYTYLKFVVATEADAEEALEATDIYRAAGFTGPVYLMPVGGVDNVYYMNNRTVAELAMKHGLRYSPRLQVDLFSNAWGT
jgi:7-carboxy-7-deazaguanine synthase